MSYQGALVLILAALVRALPGQAVWFPNIDDPLGPYFALAQAGDVVQLADSHPPFTLSKGLTLVAPASGTRIIDWSGFPAVGSTTITVPAGQRARLVGVHFDRICNFNGCFGGGVVTNGDVAFDDCSFTPQDSSCLSVMSGTVAMVRCTIAPHPGDSAPAASLQVDAGATCSLIGSTIHGTDAGVTLFGQQVPSSAAVHVDGTLLLSHCTLVGGAGTFFGTVEPSSPALRCIAGTAFVTDTVMTGGSGISSSGSHAGAAAAQASGNLFLARSVLQPGPGSPVGSPSTGFSNVPEMVGMQVLGAATLGGALTARAAMGTAPGPLAMVAALERSVITGSPFLEPLLLDPTHVLLLGFSAPSAGGIYDQVLPVPNTISIVGTAVWVQALQFDGAGLRMSALAGGIIRS